MCPYQQWRICSRLMPWLRLNISLKLHTLHYKIHSSCPAEIWVYFWVEFYLKTCLYYFRLMLSSRDLETIIHAFISSRLDCRNAVHLGTSQSLVNQSQLVQNAAAGLLTGTRKMDRITPILTSLQWLPVRYRIDFKALLIFFFLHFKWSRALVFVRSCYST